MMENRDKWAGFWFLIFLVLAFTNVLNVISVGYHLSIKTAGWLDFYKTLALVQGLYIVHREVKREMDESPHWLI